MEPDYEAMDESELLRISPGEAVRYIRTLRQERDGWKQATRSKTNAEELAHWTGYKSAVEDITITAINTLKGEVS